MDQFIFGIFEDGQLIYPIGGVFTAVIEQAEAIALLLAPSFNGRLPAGQYLAYDYAKNQRLR